MQHVCVEVSSTMLQSTYEKDRGEGRKQVTRFLIGSSSCGACSASMRMELACDVRDPSVKETFSVEEEKKRTLFVPRGRCRTRTRGWCCWRHPMSRNSDYEAKREAEPTCVHRPQEIVKELQALVSRRWSSGSGSGRFTGPLKVKVSDRLINR